MFTELYIEAPLADEELAELAWDARNVGQANDQIASIAWTVIVLLC